ncbi:MAG: hypothetical protein IKN27_13365 [Selenomonadaceae bacterium]|nr:hypothetical protein [Selenomonadaceae bacterium]
MKISAHWKVFDRSGAEIDFIEKTLREITQCGVDRTHTPIHGNYNAQYILKGNVTAQALEDACRFMEDSGAYPV